MKYRGPVIVASAVLLALAGVIAYRQLLVGESVVSLPVVDDCHLQQQACNASLPSGGSLRLDIEPKQPTPSDPLRVTAAFEQVNPAAVGVRLKGVNMNMGYLEHFVYELKRDQGNVGPVSFSGSAGVFACSSTVMQWLVLAQVEVDGTRYEIPFHFETRQK